MTSKEEQIIDHFTSDPQLKERILAQIKKLRGKQTTFDAVIDHFTSDPQIKAKILDIAKVAGDQANKSGGPLDLSAITKYQLADNVAGMTARDVVLKHRGAVEQILNSPTAA
jgi:hypothetical protein